MERTDFAVPPVSTFATLSRLSGSPQEGLYTPSRITNLSVVALCRESATCYSFWPDSLGKDGQDRVGIWREAFDSLCGPKRGQAADEDKQGRGRFGFWAERPAERR